MKLAIIASLAIVVAASSFALAGEGDKKGPRHPAAPATAEPDAAGALTLTADLPVEGEVSTVSDEGSVKTFAFRVPRDALVARLDLEGRADVDLFVARRPMTTHARRARDAAEPGKAPEDEPDADEAVFPLARSAQPGVATEQVTLFRDGDPPLEPGLWFADVSYERDDPPVRADGTEIESVQFRLSLTVIRSRVDGRLEPGKPAAGTIDPKDGGFRTYTIDVPEGTAALRLDLYDAPADLNLRERHGRPMIGKRDAEKTSAGLLGTEVIVLKGDDLAAGTYYVDVYDPHDLEFSVPFKLRATFGTEPDPELTRLPALAAPRTPLERAIFSTVELVDEEGGGSGVLISDAGYLLTNYHVVQDKVESRGMVGEPISVGLTLDPRDPPHEMFRARVVTSSADLDLALLKCVSGYYGQPIAPEFKFPTAALGAAERLAVGDPLFVVGYPSAGGTGSRVSVTYTRGVVAGFERRGATLHMKTDAMINSGNSGGAALDAQYELVGFPTEVVGDDDAAKHGQIGYIRPLWLVPEEWWRMAGVEPRRKGQ